MRCINCGFEVVEGLTVCPNCGEELFEDMPSEDIQSFNEPVNTPADNAAISQPNFVQKNTAPFRARGVDDENNNQPSRNKWSSRRPQYNRNIQSTNNNEDDAGNENDDVNKSNDDSGEGKNDVNGQGSNKSSSPSESNFEIGKEAVGKKIKAKIVTAIVSNLPIIIAIFAVIFLILGLVSFFNTDDSLSSSTSNPRARNSQNYSCNQTSDSPISVTSTPLSRQEFIDKVNEYNSSNKHYQKFKEHAGEIYDLGVQVGINPELPVIRAFNEGFSPGIRDGSDSYNYWGIGCYNKTDKYARYGSFMEGVRGYYDVILSYNTDSIIDVMYKYAYIGNNWFCPGNPSDGGCYYKKYIKPYLLNINPDRYNEVEYSCSNCTEIKTNKDDQTAYTHYQVNDTIMYYRKQIFGLGSDNVKICTDYRVNLVATPTDRDNNSIISGANGKSIKDIIVNAGSTFESFNDGLLKTVTEAGPGSREAVGKAAIYLINTLEMHGYILPYSWSGGHGANYTDKNGNFHNQTVHEYYGFNPNWGEDIYTNGEPGYDANGNKYTALGLDCSGFVAWALRNGGVEHPLVNAKDYKSTGVIKTYNPEDTASYIGQTGDVLSSNKHTSLILSYNKDKESYLVAEENGKDYGLIIQYRNIHNLASNEHEYRVVDLSDYYDNHKISDFTNKFNAGRMK